MNINEATLIIIIRLSCFPFLPCRSLTVYIKSFPPARWPVQYFTRLAQVVAVAVVVMTKECFALF